MKKNIPRSDCPISFALDFVGDKWSLLVIRDLALEGKRFYKEFLKSKEGIATNILSDRLKKLESAGIVTSKVYEKLKTQKEYALTQKGIDLVPVLVEIILWSAKYENDLAVPQDFLDKAAKQKALVIKNIQDRLSHSL
ncbi:MAG: helix-turn-helix domain-containing protein [Bacteroidota bacterium]